MMLKLRWRHLGLVALGLILPAAASAALTSPHYRLDPSVANNIGGSAASSSYKLRDAGGEPAVGSGSSGSYRLAQGYVRQLTQALQVSVLPTGIAADYPLDTGLGVQAYDVSTNENRAALAAAPSWVTGKIGQALLFNGTSQSGDAGNAGSLQLGTGTLEVWVKTSATCASYCGIMVKNNAYGLLIHSSLLVAADYTTGTIVDRSSGVNIADGNWHQVAISFQSGVTNGSVVYVDGLAKLTSTIGVHDQASNLIMGATTTGSQWLAGTIDEAKLYNRVLNAAEIANDYAAGNTGISNAVTMPGITPGTSQVANFDAVVRTDAGGYTLGIAQNHDLLHTDAVTTIPAISSTIASPAAWVEGTTKGLGFTLTAGGQVEGKWGTNPTYFFAAIPLSNATFHSRTGLTGGVAERNTLSLREDTVTAQKSGTYSNTVTITATVIP